MTNDPWPFRPIHGLILATFAILGLLAAYRGDPIFFFQQIAEVASPRPRWPGLPRRLAEAELPAKRVECDFASFLLVFTLGAGLATLRPFARRRRGRPPCPGLAAIAAATVAVLAEATVNVVGFLHEKAWDRWPVLLTFWNPSPVYLDDLHYGFAVEARVTGAILGVWAYLAVAGWHPRDDWRDRLGRWLGWCWLATVGFHILAPALWG